MNCTVLEYTNYVDMEVTPRFCEQEINLSWKEVENVKNAH